MSDGEMNEVRMRSTVQISKVGYAVDATTTSKDR